MSVKEQTATTVLVRNILQVQDQVNKVNVYYICEVGVWCASHCGFGLVVIRVSDVGAQSYVLYLSDLHSIDTYR